MEARFNSTRGIVPVAEGYIVSDSGNQCLRQIKPLAENSEEMVWMTSRYAGKCGISGFANGSRLDAILNYPKSLVRQGDALYFTDGSNWIRKIDMTSEVVTSIHQSIHSAESLILGPHKQEFFVGTQYGILHVQNDMERWLVGGCRGATSNQSSKAKFSEAGFAKLTTVTKWSNDLLLVPDNHVIKIVDMDSQTVDVICSGQEGMMDGSVKSCKLYLAECVTALPNLLVIGDNSTIRMLPYQFTDSSNTTSPDRFCKEPDPIPNARYTKLPSYPEGTEIYYQCVDSYSTQDATNSKLVCVATDVDELWAGPRIHCRLSKASATVLALAPATIITFLALIIVTVKWYKDHKRLREAEAIKARDTQLKTRQLPSHPAVPSIPDKYETLFDSPLSHSDDSNSGDSDSISTSISYLEPGIFNKLSNS
ncbi:uncharacterized protein [Watersipora subatra]|uniref:uncharacterized protein n=1 Tax=Watersipora subatra TaxID=2589382 RepID=UPI00355B0746